MNEATYYDNIISLGGNCSAASQLKQRGLRLQAMPFDYFFLRNEEDLKKAIFALKNNFENCFLKTHLRELNENERRTSNLYQYQDMVSGYNIIPLFKRPIDNDKEYRECKKIIDRRIKRFFEACKLSKKICFILSLDFHIKEDIILELYNVLSQITNGDVTLVLLLFNADENKIDTSANITIIKTTRSSNIYDYAKTNYEWSFLDSYKLCSRFKSQRSIFTINKIKKGYQIILLNFINTILRFNIYLFGLRLDFCIGKLRD